MNPPLAPLAHLFARCLGALDPGRDALLEQTLELVSRAVSEGHVCISLDAYAGKRSLDGEEPAAPAPPDSRTWTERLRQSPLIGRPGDFKPLILDERGRLYLARYWQYEKILADNLLARARRPLENVDAGNLRETLDALFAHNRENRDLQKAAAAAAVLQRFCVISGGPGTGKTSTVVRLLAALQMQKRGQVTFLTQKRTKSNLTPFLRIALAAPTGKAAARMQDAIRGAKQTLALDPAVLDAIPEHASTLHRLLGSRPDSVYFRRHRGNRLPVDVLVVDEASMIDLALMAKAADALPDAARLILLGDKDQLASVEAGAVFGEICACRGHDEAFREKLLAASGVDIGAPESAAAPLGNAILLLEKSYRFSADSGIGELARLINRNRPAEALALLGSGRFADIAWRDEPLSGLEQELGERLDLGYAAYFDAVRQGAGAAAAFRLFEGFKVLTAHREGDTGIAAVNERMEERLRARRRIPPGSRWYPGRPVMVTHNDYHLKLFNGDIGIALMEKDELRVFFEAADGKIRSIAPARLPPHETVYAMTVHKSQGSEFDRVLMLLPDVKTPVLNRALLYTGITRARKSVEIWGPGTVLEQAIKTLPARASGLLDRLTG